MTDETGRGRPLDDETADDGCVVLRYTPVGRAARRLVFSRRDIADAGDEGGAGDEDRGETDAPAWLRSEQVRAHDGTWREVGSELVSSVTVEQYQKPQ